MSRNSSTYSDKAWIPISPYKPFNEDPITISKHGLKQQNKEKRSSAWKESIWMENKQNTPIEFWPKKNTTQIRTGFNPTTTIRTQMLWTSIIYKPYWRTTRILSRIKKTLTTNKKPPTNASRSWYTKPSTIFLPKIRRSRSRKGNASTVEHQDTSLLDAQTNPTSKLYPATRPIRLRRISSPKKLTKNKTSQKTYQKKKNPQQPTLTLMTKRRIFPKATRNYA